MQWLFASGATIVFGVSALFDPYFTLRGFNLGIVIFSAATFASIIHVIMYYADFFFLARVLFILIIPHALASLIALWVICIEVIGRNEIPNRINQLK